MSASRTIKCKLKLNLDASQPDVTRGHLKALLTTDVAGIKCI